MQYRAWVLMAALGMAAGCGEEEGGGLPAPAIPITPSVPELPSVLGAWAQQASGTGEDIVAVSALDTDRAWVADAGGNIRATQDGGATWAFAGILPRHTNMPNTPTLVNQLEFIDESHGWARSTYMLLSTSDGGATWTKRMEFLAHYVGQGLWTWFPTPMTRDFSFISPTEGWVATTQGTRHTTDGGETWTEESFPAQDFIFTSQSAWRVSSRKLYKSADQGQTWLLYGNVDQDYVYDLSAIDDTRAWVLAAGHVYRTESGSAWTVRFLDGSRHLQFIDAAHGWAVGQKIHHSLDGGLSWVVQTTPHTAFNGVAFVNASAGWVVGDGGVILKTETGGQ
jgi:photosystem II stability/assembly factor-like uncharacterized protein